MRDTGGRAWVENRLSTDGFNVTREADKDIRRQPHCGCEQMNYASAFRSAFNVSKEHLYECPPHWIRIHTRRRREFVWCGRLWGGGD